MTRTRSASRAGELRSTLKLITDIDD